MFDSAIGPYEPQPLSYVVVPSETTSALLSVLSRWGVAEPQFTLHRCDQGVALRIFIELSTAITEELSAMGGQITTWPQPCPARSG